MPDLSSGAKLRHCRICGRSFAASDTALEACEECAWSLPRNAKDDSSKPTAAAAKGLKSSGGGTWITPSGEKLPDDSKAPVLPTKTKWRSPPFAIRFPESDQREQPPPPRRKRPPRLLLLLRSRKVMALFAVLAVGGVLYSRYGVPKFLLLPVQRSLAGPRAAFQQTAPAKPTGSSLQQRQEAFRQRQKEDRLRQQKAAIPRHP